MVDEIHAKELQLNKADVGDSEAQFLGLNLSISNDNISLQKFMTGGMTLILILC